MKKNNESFPLYDLRIEVIGDQKKFVCHHKAGRYFELSGENLSIPNGQTVTIYSLAALMPLLSAKQRMTDPNDFMTTDTDVACPDPNCGALFRISRSKKRIFQHNDVTVVPIPRKGK